MKMLLVTECRSYLKKHADPNENERSFDLVSPLDSTHNSCPSTVRNLLRRFLVDGRMVLEGTHASKLLLPTGDVQKLTVGGME